MKQTFTLFFFSFISLVHAQKVQFEGLKRTKSSYLLKFMQWDKGVSIDSVSIAKGVQRIRNTLLSLLSHEAAGLLISAAVVGLFWALSWAVQEHLRTHFMALGWALGLLLAVASILQI